MIRLGQAHVETLAREAEAAYPNECCGLLIGRKDGGDWSIHEIVPSTNLSDNPATGFEIDTALRLRLQKQLRGTENAVIGHYHSHPDTPAQPSPRDRERAWEDDMVWVIVGIEKGVAAEPAAYLFESGDAGFSALAIEIEG